MHDERQQQRSSSLDAALGIKVDYHRPVMVEECLAGLALRADGVYVDATFGGGGHSRAILDRLGSSGRLLAFDRDGEALANAPADERLTLIGEDFRHLKSFLRLHGVRRIDGLLADLGVSSHQIDSAERGFSTRLEGPLDLRMDRRQGLTAADVVNTLEPKDLERVLRLYGELSAAHAMTAAIVRAREAEPIATTQGLCEAVRPLLPRGRENKVLAQLFQALRIEVNGELEALQALLRQGADLLAEGGRMCIIAYHSLEDRLVKNFFRSGHFDGSEEKDFFGNLLAPLRPVERKPIVASEDEVAANNRARSAKLRVAEKVGQREKETTT